MRTPICWKCQEVLTKRILIEGYSVIEIIGCKLLDTDNGEESENEKVDCCPLYGKRKKSGIVKSKSRVINNLIKRCFRR